MRLTTIILTLAVGTLGACDLAPIGPYDVEIDTPTACSEPNDPTCPPPSTVVPSEPPLCGDPNMAGNDPACSPPVSTDPPAPPPVCGDPNMSACRTPDPIRLDSGESSFPVKPPCVGDTVLIDWFETDTPCDLIPPQMLVKRMPDLTADSRTGCHNRGGSVLVDNTAGAAYCLNLDY